MARGFEGTLAVALEPKMCRGMSVLARFVYGRSLPANKRQHFVELLLHQFMIAGLNIQAQQRFRVGRAHIEPPVAKINGDAVEVIDGLSLRAIVLFERL